MSVVLKENESVAEVQERVISLRIMDSIMESENLTVSEFVASLQDFINSKNVEPNAKFSTVCRDFNNSRKGVTTKSTSAKSTDHLKELIKYMFDEGLCIIKGKILKIQNSRKNIEHGVYFVKIEQAVGEASVHINMSDLRNVSIFSGTLCVQSGIDLSGHSKFVEASTQLEDMKRSFTLTDSIHNTKETVDANTLVNDSGDDFVEGDGTVVDNFNDFGDDEFDDDDDTDDDDENEEE